MNTKKIKVATLAATIITSGSLAGRANATTLVLDDTNGYSVTVAPGITISQPLFTATATAAQSRVVFSGATAALGAASVADFSVNTFTEIGRGSRPRGNGVLSFARDSVAFTIRDDSSLQLYDALITFARSTRNNTTGGTAPTMDNNAGLVIEVTAVTVPEPSSTALIGLGCFGLALRRTRR